MQCLAKCNIPSDLLEKQIKEIRGMQQYTLFDYPNLIEDFPLVQDFYN